ncbi:LytR C-terminal domain-containing protein [Nocardioides sp.]|uniref:LytR C-terminal domain-containing protein n=1 Tax=Nocardioides sp. TaxID=35761 RepID=UPI00262062AC|nr:LytR C-terminal domain-containing protein [Nocardioides sp.]MDI6910501.1 LytR C-terminal domain-containing protein [Nocardioides sp.]
MREGARSAITISVLGLLLVAAALWGWSAATDPLPAKVDTPICVDRTVEAGTKVFAQDVTVSVYNAGIREGLAGRTMQLLTDDGFAEGNSGNVSARVDVVQIWTLEPQNPAVRLVASRLGPDVEIERRDGPGVGVAVVVGDGFRDLVDGRRSVAAQDDATICSPPVG